MPEPASRPAKSTATALPVLYSFRRCPYAMRARLALRYAGVRCELREVVLRDKPTAMLEASPKGTVPVLVLNAGTGAQDVIDESLDIMFWALAQHDPEGWLNCDMGEADRLIAGNDDDFKVWLDRYKYPDRFDDIGTANPRDECGRFLTELEARLGSVASAGASAGAGAWLTGAHVSVVDIALFPFVRQFAFTDIDWFRSGVYPRLEAWLERLLNSELFAAVMHKYPAWRPGDEVTVF